MFWELGLLVLSLAAAISTHSVDVPQGESGMDTTGAGALINKTDPFRYLDAAGVPINDTESLMIFDEDVGFPKRNSIEERKGCSPTISCTRAGGYCIKARADCDGTVDTQGCRGGRKCKCCLPGPTVNPNLSWLTVGSDRFVRFPQAMNWLDARSLCRRNGLDLYEPKDVLGVAIYLDDNYSDKWYWIGGRGNGTHQVWLSGKVLTRSDPWYSTYYNNVGTNDCLAIITHSGYANRGTTLVEFSCTGNRDDVLCG